MYLYINIRSDSSYSKNESVAVIKSILDKQKEIVTDEFNTYKNTVNFPWLVLNIINCDSDGNYPAGLKQQADSANLIEMICSDDGDKNKKEKYVTLAKSIAKHLKWEAIDDHTGQKYFNN